MHRFHPVFVFILFCILITAQSANGQVGLGAKGVLNYPGVLVSDSDKIRFKAGIGYGFFVRHDVYSTVQWKIDFRYSAVISAHTAKLPRSGDTDYEFSNFSIDLIIGLLSAEFAGFYSGISANLLSAVSNSKYTNNYTAESIYPSLIIGWSYQWADGFDFFVEGLAGFGSTTAGPEKIPITGPALHTGFTMYISE